MIPCTTPLVKGAINLAVRRIGLVEVLSAKDDRNIRRVSHTTLRSDPSDATLSSDSWPSSPQIGLAVLPTVTWRVTGCCVGCALMASCLCNSCELHAGDGDNLRGDLSGRSPSARNEVLLQGRRCLVRPFALAFVLTCGLPWSASTCCCRQCPHWCVLL